MHARSRFIEAEEAIPKAARSPNQLATRFIRLIAKRYRAEVLTTQWTQTRRQQLLLTHVHVVAPSSLLSKALHYLHGQWPKLVRFVDNGAGQLDSNPVENAIRPYAMACS